MTPFKMTLCAAGFIFLFACSEKKQTEPGSGGGGLEFNVPNAGGFEPWQGTATTSRKLIKKGEISFRSESITGTKRFLQKTILACHGYISNESIESYRINPTEILTVRVPTQQFDTLLAIIGRHVGEFDSRKTDIDDVTEEYVDIEARLNTKKQLEARYLELLKKANGMEDILNIEKELSAIREEIESTQGRLRYLSNQVDYSTLKITYYEEKPQEGFHFLKKIRTGLADGGTGFLAFVVVMVQLWPLWLGGFLLWFVIRKLVRHRKNKRPENSPDM